jgi:predicted alpha/beta superfamily hydrolase
MTGRKFSPRFSPKGVKMALIETFPVTITALKRKRTIRVCLPSDYGKGNFRYPVLYMHDGHNLFSVAASGYGKIWDAHLACDEFARKTGKGIIIVGIDADPRHRFDEYSPWRGKETNKFLPALNMEKAGGEGDKYAAWLATELLSLIEGRYRADGERYMAGSSMGAFLSFYCGFKYPGLFRKIGCFSTAFWFARKEMMSFLKENFDSRIGVYLDVGTREGGEDDAISKRYYEDTLEVYRLLKELGLPGLTLRVAEGAIHDEVAWKKRFPGFLEWLLSDS